MWVFGTFIMTISIIVVSVKVALETTHWVWMTWASIGLSLISYIVMRFSIGYLVKFLPDEYHVFTSVLKIPTFYMAILLCVVTSLLPDFTMK